MPGGVAGAQSIMIAPYADLYGFSLRGQSALALILSLWDLVPRAQDYQ